ncbi:MAG: hypothetical protein ACREH5_08180 [Candidatus Omnitrophota bacterium]
MIDPTLAAYLDEVEARHNAAATPSPFRSSFLQIHNDIDTLIGHVKRLAGELESERTRRITAEKRYEVLFPTTRPAPEAK